MRTRTDGKTTIAPKVITGQIRVLNSPRHNYLKHQITKCWANLPAVRSSGATAYVKISGCR